MLQSSSWCVPASVHLCVLAQGTWQSQSTWEGSSAAARQAYHEIQPRRPGASAVPTLDRLARFATLHSTLSRTAASHLPQQQLLLLPLERGKKGSRTSAGVAPYLDDHQELGTLGHTEGSNTHGTGPGSNYDHQTAVLAGILPALVCRQKSPTANFGCEVVGGDMDFLDHMPDCVAEGGSSSAALRPPLRGVGHVVVMQEYRPSNRRIGDSLPRGRGEAGGLLSPAWGLAALVLSWFVGPYAFAVIQARNILVCVGLGLARWADDSLSS